MASVFDLKKATTDIEKNFKPYLKKEMLKILKMHNLSNDQAISIIENKIFQMLLKGYSKNYLEEGINSKEIEFYIKLDVKNRNFK